ncbi:MAG: hypothetical protein COB22_05170 [Cycloclasticus sp.]|nr:MAG: hypothetical protein COB22_05170 [Cycloclasticus sp.]
MIIFGREEKGMRYIVLRPNSSLSTRQALIFFAGISMVFLLIACIFLCMGLRMILPFSGLELAVLAYCLILALKKGKVQEVITISEKPVLVQRGLEEVEKQEELQMGWVQVNLEKPTHRGYPSSLIIRSHGRRIEVGHFLVESERKKLAKQLKQWL